MITEKTYIAPGGQWILPTSDLANKKVYVVHREGNEIDLTLSAPVGRKVRHDVPTGFLHFDPLIPFAGDPAFATDLDEHINVIYEA